MEINYQVLSVFLNTCANWIQVMSLNRYYQNLFYIHSILEGVYVAIENPTFCLFLYLTDLHFRGALQHVGDASEWKINFSIRTREIDGVSLPDVLYVSTLINLILYLKKGLNFLESKVHVLQLFWDIIIPLRNTSERYQGLANVWFVKWKNIPRNSLVIIYTSAYVCCVIYVFNIFWMLFM